MSTNKDMTFTPRFYADDKILLQTEYRQVNKNSNHFSDLSFLKKKIKVQNLICFININASMNYDYFEDSSFKLNIEKTSNDTYLKTSKLKSPLIEDYDVLENSIEF